MDGIATAAGQVEVAVDVDVDVGYLAATTTILSTAVIGCIVIGIVLILSIGIGLLALMLQKRRTDRRAKVMVTMSGTTTITDNGRQFTEAEWIPDDTPSVITTIPPAAYVAHPAVHPAIAAVMSRHENMNRPNVLQDHTIGAIQAATSDHYNTIFNNALEQQQAQRLAQPQMTAQGLSYPTPPWQLPVQSPRAVKRSSYRSMKRLDIPAVLQEDHDAEMAASEEYMIGGASGSSSTIGTGPNVSAVTVASENSKGKGLVWVTDVASSSQGSDVDHDLSNSAYDGGDVGRMV
ncbi:hypothetical protein ABW21_db0204323 [Orbilia brochopaga]|nr:hypothetical protein ABW21_db0204323 [Drechslerella brochopaga]